MLARKFILKRQFEGVPKLDDFELVEEKLREIEDGGKKLQLLSVTVYGRYK